MISKVDFTTEWRNHSHSNFALFGSSMTDEEEFAARWQFKWQRDGSDWILLYHRRRMGRVVPDPAKPGMYRSLNLGTLATSRI
jgi:hypothetical protein